MVINIRQLSGSGYNTTLSSAARVLQDLYNSFILVLLQLCRRLQENKKDEFIFYFSFIAAVRAALKKLNIFDEHRSKWIVFDRVVLDKLDIIDVIRVLE